MFILLRSTPMVTSVWAILGDNPVMMTLAPIRRDASTVCTRWLATDASTSGEPVMSGATPAQASGHAAHDGPDAEIVNQIKELLDTRVRPAVAQDGGDITFHGFDRGVVYLHMQGACAGCPSSTLTLKMGIENLLRHYIPEVVEVRPVA